MVSELRTLANHYDTAQMTTGHIVDEIGRPVLGRAYSSLQLRPSYQLVDLRRRAGDRSMTTSATIYNPIKRLHDAVVLALSSLLLD